MEIHDIVKKLIGNIDPVGETHIDEERFENLKATCELVDILLTDIDKVIPNNKRAEFSMKRAGDYANDFFDKIGIEK